MADQNERPWYLGLLEQRVQLGDDVGAGLGIGASALRPGSGVDEGAPLSVSTRTVPGRSYTQTRFDGASPAATGGGLASATLQMSPALPNPDCRITVGDPVPWHSR